MSSASEKGQEIVMGKVGNNGHPVHPATVHFPIAFLSLSYGLDILYGVATNSTTSGLVRSVVDVTPYLGDISKISHYSNTLGLITMIPSLTTGIVELWAMIKGQDLQGKLKRSNDKVGTLANMHPKLKIAFIHAILNDVALVGSAYNWWTRSSIQGYAPQSSNIWTSVGLLTGLMGSAYLGGSLVYEYGVGVQRQGAGKQIKEKGKSN